MSIKQSASPPGVPKTREKSISRVPRGLVRVGMLLLLVIPVFVAWQVLNYVINNTDPTVAGRPLSNPKTHLHQVALGGENRESYTLAHTMVSLAVLMVDVAGLSSAESLIH